MPRFPLDERERVALTLFLSSLTTLPVSDPQPPPDAARGGRNAARDGERLVRSDLGCLGCHTLGESGGGSAIALERVGERLNEAWIHRYLMDPRAFDSTTPMPDLFFERRDGRAHPVHPDAASRLGAVVAFLISLASERRAEQGRAFERAQRRYANVAAADGATLFRSLGCGGCHKGPDGYGAALGPRLLGVTRRLELDWIRRFLAGPQPVRPSGFPAGTWSRMPDFDLSPAEIDAIMDYLDRGASTPPPLGAEPTALSVFSRAKARSLIRDRLPCLGCHALDGEGGRIGPDLSDAGRRLRPAYVAAVIRDPGSALGDRVMPRIPMPDDRVALLAAFLSGGGGEPSAATYVSPLDVGNRDAAQDASGAGLYGRFCAGCHGPSGNSDGYNVATLPVRPTRLADSAYMSARPDDTLFDGIHAGGHILGRHHRMPGFGFTLSGDEIDRVVGYLRELCRCQGPAWSRDDQEREP